MARIRTTKPEFWTSEQVTDCSPMARLLFIGMWNFCDDAGNHPASAKTLKAEVFPSDDITSASVQLLVDELLANSLIVLYTAPNKDYWHVTGWHKHQKIDKPTYKHPPYSEELEVPRRTLGEASPTEGNGVEGNGMEGDLEGNGKQQSSDTSTSVGASATEKNEDDDESRIDPKDRPRRVNVAILLRSLGVKPFTSMTPICCEWAENPKITDELLTAAIDQARQYKPEGDIHPNYLAPIVAELLLPKRDDNTWKRTHEGIERKGRELGLFANRNEDYPAFADRITKEIQKRKREGAPA